MEQTFQQIKAIQTDNLLENFQNVSMLRDRIKALYDEMGIEIAQASQNIAKARSEVRKAKAR